MRKRILITALLAVIFVLVFAISVSAASVEYKGIYYTTNDTDFTASVNNKNATDCKLTDVVIPETIEYNNNTYTVTAIDYHAFSGTQSGWGKNQTIQTLEIPATVTSIGGHFLRECKSITSVVIKAKNANGIVLNDAEFYNCTSLETVDMSESDITSFKQYQFYGCSSLVTVKYPPKLTKIGGQCFRGCSKLTSGDLSGTQISSIDSWGLGGCTSITELKVPTTLRSISGNALQDMKITKLVLPHGFHTLGNDSLPFNNNLYMIIMPEIAEDNTTIHAEAMHSTNPKVIIYSGDTYAHLTGSGKIFAGYTVKPFSEYEPNTTYTTKTFFYGATTCSNCNGLLADGTSFEYTDYLSSMKETQGCTNCDAKTTVSSYAPMFKFLGYSAPEKNGVYAFCIGYSTNKESIKTFEEKTDKTVSFGVVAVATERITGGKTPLEMVGTVPVIYAPIENQYGSVTLKINGFTEAQKAIELTMSLYVTVTEGEASSTVYIQGTQSANPSSYSIAQYESDLA